MATIGTFISDGNSFTGTITTLTLQSEAKILPNRKVSEHGPDYRVYAAGAEVGAAWIRTSQAQRSYLSITFDDPSFPQPIQCRLIEDRDGNHKLLWNR